MKRTYLFAIAAIAGIFVMAAVAQFAFASTKKVEMEYVKCPFEKIPENTPRILMLSEPPKPDDKEAREKFWAERKVVSEYMKNEGCERDATPDERQALDAIESGKYVRALEQSTKVLRANPKSIAGLFVRAQALANGEANPAKALNLFRRGRHLLEECGKANPADSIAREWYLRVLDHERSVLLALGRDADALRCVDLMEQVYAPMPWEKVWSLFRLNRLNEAEIANNEADQTGRWPNTVLNSKGALAGMKNRRSETYECFKELASRFSAEMVYRKNYALAALENLHFAESEAAYLEAAKITKRYSSNTAYTELAGLYVQEGRFSDAAEALKNGRKQRSKRDPSTWQFDQGDCDQALTFLLMTTGNLKDAERFARRSCDRPSRLGTSTQSETIRDYFTCLTLLSVLENRKAEVNELGVVDGWFSSYAARRSIDLESWVLQKQLIKLLDQKQLSIALLPMSDSNVIPWMNSELTKFLPYGILASTIQRNRAEDSYEGIGAYYDAIQAEAEYRRGSTAEAQRLAQSALEKLDVDGEKLLRCRLQVMSAMIHFKQGEMDEGIKMLDPVLPIYPSALRLLNGYIPVNIDDDATPAASQFARVLRRSPRLRQTTNGLKIHIAHRDGKLTVEMMRASNERHLSVEVPCEDAKVIESSSKLYRQFHERLMSPIVALDQSAINHLDGSPQATTADQTTFSQLVKETSAK